MAESFKFTNKSCWQKPALLVVVQLVSPLHLITGISTSGVSVGDLIDNANFIAGTKVATIGASLVTADRDSTNSGASSQIVKFLEMTTAFTQHPLQRVF